MPSARGTGRGSYRMRRYGVPCEGTRRSEASPPPHRGAMLNAASVGVYAVGSQARKMQRQHHRPGETTMAIRTPKSSKPAVRSQFAPATVAKDVREAKKDRARNDARTVPS